MEPNWVAAAQKHKGSNDTELKQYNDRRAPKTATKEQMAGRHTVWPPPMYMNNAKLHEASNEMNYPIRTMRQKCFVDVEDVSGDRGKGSY